VRKYFDACSSHRNYRRHRAGQRIKYIFQVVQNLALPRLRTEGDRIKNILDSPLLNNIDKTAAEHLRTLLVVHKHDFLIALVQLSAE